MEHLTAREREAVAAADLRATMGHFATGVAVITAADADGRLLGTTANAISSLSLDPPLVLACLRHASETLGALRETDRFAVNVLGADQRELSDRFARPTGAETWAGVAHRRFDGVPVLDGALATVECEVHEIADAGDHAIVIGRVLAVAHPDDHADPLLFYRGRYAELDPPPQAAAPPVDVAPEITLPSALGALRMLALDGEASVAVLLGAPHGTSGAIVHVHRGCLLGDALGSQVCRGRERLHAVLDDVQRSGRPGVIVYHRDDAAPFGACCLSGDAGPSALTAAEQRALDQAIAALDLVDPVVVGA